MLKAYIIEDEAKAIDLLSSYIRKIDFLELKGSARDSLKAFNYLQENEVDILFLDINMPVLSGLELYKSISRPPQVIFTTAYPEYAVEGFNLEAVDYLLKPISFPRFLRACEKLLKQQKNVTSPLEQHSDFSDIVYVKSGPITHKLSWKEILYLEKDENYVIFHTKEKRVLSRQTLTDLEEIFPNYILRIHKSYAISLLHIDQVEREFLKISCKELPIGRTYRIQLMEGLNFIKG
ncbi:LytR/AlgR family response regulator transcription factor [Xanthovirga aplysinae]|uniref:LytR/AlgR family response regulator transcription factor n=1 Tax=Xanthovirga aplysinae TaxID=2529853 RepID=UPI0012BB7254|nr:LytTR family DNA-binding domain-containing protein [Xanthovirga aplysinae]MTI30811.1 response regulator transcription factor [Xanthovirga aplysinae]